MKSPVGTGAFLHKLRGLSLVRRWNFHPIIKEESVAEHSFWVAVYAMVLCDLEDWHDVQSGPKQHRPMSAILMTALIHDWEETVTGDLPSLVKRTCREQWTEVEVNGMAELMNTLALSSPCRRYRSFWRHDDSTISPIVHAADLLDRLMYAALEKERGNRSFDRIQEETIKQLRSLNLWSVNKVLEELGVTSEGVDLPNAMTHM